VTWATRPRRSAVAIAGRGVGVACGEPARVAESLFTIKTTGPGLGLGTTRSFFEKTQRTPCVTGEPGTGSAFAISLPAIEARAAGLTP
jgi:signal transduction histidine kinase